MPRQLLARGRMKITTNERISIVPQVSENVFQLRFDPVVKEDGGEYRCVYNHKTGVKYKVVVVNIQGECIPHPLLRLLLLLLPFLLIVEANV